jgi:hypothetical protein
LLTLVTPAWLAGLLLVPLIRWLHRGGRHRRAVSVSYLRLWRAAAERSPAAGERQPPDPAWRRRALLAALLFVALAQPQWPERRPGLTLWVDDSLSMLTRETQGTRLAEGLAQARALLAESAGAEVDVRTLADPWRSLGALTEATVATIVAGAGTKPPNVPPAALLRRDHAQWLVTDGADAALFDWPGDRRPDRVIQVAGVTRNVGLERLSARRSLDDPDRVDLLLMVANGGTAAETREVAFITAAGEQARSTQRLEPGASAFVRASIPASTSVRATLSPGDALAEDDAIVLDLAALRRRRVAVDPTCPAALGAAVGAHPALTRVPEPASDVAAALDCGSPGAARELPTLRVRADQLPRPARGAVQWASSAAAPRDLGLDADRLQLGARLQVQPADAVLLAVGDEPVVVRRAGASALLETSIDFAAMTRGPELPRLVNWMFERVLGGPLLDDIAVIDRGAGAARVAPVARTAAPSSAPAPADAGEQRDRTRPLLLVALLVLLWEIAALARQWRRLDGPAGAAST